MSELTETPNSESTPAVNTQPSKAEADSPPAAKRGFVNIPLRSDKHAVVITAALAGSGLQSTVEGHWLVAKAAEATELVDTVGSYATKMGKVIYDARLAMATLVMLRHEFPGATDPKSGVTSKLVDSLNAAKANGKIDDWTVSIKLDGTLSWSWAKDGESHDGGARQLAETFVVDAPTGSRAAKASKASKQIKTLNAKKAASKAAREAGHPIPDEQLKSMTAEQADKVAEARRTHKAPAAKAS